MAIGSVKADYVVTTIVLLLPLVAFSYLCRQLDCFLFACRDLLLASLIPVPCLQVRLLPLLSVPSVSLRPQALLFTQHMISLSILDLICLGSADASFSLWSSKSQMPLAVIKDAFSHQVTDIAWFSFPVFSLSLSLCLSVGMCSCDLGIRNAPS